MYEAYERTAGGVGATLGVAVNGMAALESIGLRDLIKGKSVDSLRAVMHLGSSGKKLVEFRRFDPESADGIVGQSILRSDLYVALRDEAVRRGVTVGYRKRLAEAEGTAAGVRATFEDGSQAEGDLLVGADGLHSQVRRIIDPAAPAVQYTRFLQIGGQATGISVDAEPGVFHIVFGRRCTFCYHARQEGRIWWLATPRRRTEPGTGRGDRGAGQAQRRPAFSWPGRADPAGLLHRPQGGPEVRRRGSVVDLELPDRLGGARRGLAAGVDRDYSARPGVSCRRARRCRSLRRTRSVSGRRGRCP
ncbi:MAG: FAD-dependent monooxygenase [Pseudonocardiaceae bacterium]